MEPRTQSMLRGEGLTRIALRKYTSFSVHRAVKDFGAWPGMHPNIDRFSIRTEVPVVWSGRVCWCSRRVSFSSCCFQKGVSVTMSGRESRPTVGFERCIAQYNCFGDDRRVFSCSCSSATTETRVTFVIRHQNALTPHQNGSSPCRERWRPRGFVKFRRFRQRPAKSSVTFGIKIGVMCSSGADV